MNSNKQQVLKSPLRYPGGKARISALLSKIIYDNNLIGCKYYEPFAGGAGAALALLSNNIVSEININDADIRVYSFWYSILNDVERFIDKIYKVKVTLEEWQIQKKINESPLEHSIFDIGFSTFYLNRCNRSGILKAGPIGGLKQLGNWKLDCRFNKVELIKRLKKINYARDKIKVSNEDAIYFLRNCIPKGRGRKNCFAYIDPPYVNMGNQLYLNYYTEENHKDLSMYMVKQKKLNYIISYDDTNLIHCLYNGLSTYYCYFHYSLQYKRKGKELIIFSDSLKGIKNTTLELGRLLIKKIS